MTRFVTSYRSSLMLVFLLLCYFQGCSAIPHPSGGGDSSSGSSSSSSSSSELSNLNDVASGRSSDWTSKKPLLLGGSITFGVAAIAAAVFYANQSNDSDRKETTVSPAPFIPNQLMKETRTSPQMLASSSSSAKRWMNPAAENRDDGVVLEEQIRSAAAVLASAATAGRHSQRKLVHQQSDIELGVRPASTRTLGDEYPRLEDYPPLDQGQPQPLSKKDLIRNEFNAIMEAQKAKIQPVAWAQKSVVESQSPLRVLPNPQQMSRRDLIQAEFAAMMEEQKAKLHRNVKVDP